MKDIKIEDTIGLTTRRKRFNKQIDDALESGEDMRLLVNSPGGSVYHGVNMYNKIRMALGEGAYIEAYNTGMAASMGSMLFSAVPRANRYMAETSVLMIHNPKGIAFGDSEEMRKEKEMLARIEDIGATAYSRATGTNDKYMLAKMKRTTWYNPKEAKNEGFAGSIVDGFKEVEAATAQRMDDSAFENMPAAASMHLQIGERSPIIKPYEKDLTKNPNSKFREKIWKNYLRN